MNITFITNMKRYFNLLQQEQEVVEKLVEGLCLQVYFPADDACWDGNWIEKLQQADLVLLPWMGTGLDQAFLQRTVRFMQQRKIRYFCLVENSGKDKVSLGISEEQQQLIRQYFRYDGAENIRNCMLWMVKSFGHLTVDVPLPMALPWHGIWHPDSVGDCQDIKGYLREHGFRPRPTVGILFYRTEWVEKKFTYQTALVRELERQGMNVIAVFSNTIAQPEIGGPTLEQALDQYFFSAGKSRIDVLISCMKFSFKAAGTAIEKFQRLDVPMLAAYTLLSPREEWEDSAQGLNAMEVSISLSLPEFDGVIHAVPIAAKQIAASAGEDFVGLAERIKRVAAKAKKWVVLRHKTKEKKKVAIVLHNYPPVNSNIGSAAGLDSPESVRRLLLAMKNAGYTIEHIPQNSQQLMEEITASATNDRRFITEEQIKKAYGHLPAQQYKAFFKRLPETVQQQLEQDWGSSPGEVFYYDKQLLIPGILNGNIFITVQPPRGFGEDPGKLLHSPDCAPTHHYLGFYHWLRDIWQADAVIHVGTHGSLEWLPGKAAGLSENCYPDISLQELPNIYPYWMSIVGEGIQAKRRGAACLISHLSPPMQLAGSFDDIEELEKAVEEYLHFKAAAPDALETVKNLVRAKAKTADFSADVQEGEDFDEYVAQLHHYITDIKNLQIRTGLHILGQMPQDPDLLPYIQVLLRLENGPVASLSRLLSEIKGLSYDQLLKNSQTIGAGGLSYGKILDQIEGEALEILGWLQGQGFSPETAARAMDLVDFSKGKEKTREKLHQLLLYVCTTIIPNLEKTAQEITNTLRALDGFYIEPGPGGAPSSGGADLLPTGRNFYGVDPRLLPTPAAWEIGKQLGEAVISDYISDQGCYPEAVGIVLWAGANMRSHGQCTAEFLYLLGVRPVWQKSSQRVIGLEVIPLAELKRPRIDVTGRISGLFRDSMPEAILWLDQAVSLVSALAENAQENFIKKHMMEDAAFLEEEGLDRETAWKKASYRIFGDPPGAYGAGIGDLLESKQWESVEELAAVYTRFSGHAYNGEKIAGAYEPQLFQRRMASLDVTIKNEDNREVHMFSSDDFNAYHGGMIATVRALKGELPKSYSGDSSDRKNIKLHTIQEEARRIFRAEAMNPKFIEGMKKHGYKGAADLANYVAHSYQWDATSNVMDDWMYEKYAEKYALDEQMQQWMQEVNPWALQRISEVLLEADQRGLWQAKTQTREELQQLLLTMEGELEERSDEMAK